MRRAGNTGVAADAWAAYTWWNALTDAERKEWMQRAGNTGVAADAWAAYKAGQRSPEREPKT
jgi:hypothetical protein